MIQFNLLPDVKKDYIKAKRTKRLIMTVSVVTSVVCVLIVFLLFSIVQVGQKKHINALTSDISSEVNGLKSIEDLDKILTIQNQLTKLPALHDTKPSTSRIFTYLTQVTPTKASISSLVLSMTTQTMTISGRADSLATVNKFADTVKFVTYKTSEADAGDGVKPFTNVVTRLNRDNLGASFTLEFAFDPTIFDTTKEITLIVPNIETTRSSTGKPSDSTSGSSTPSSDDLFEAPVEGDQ